LGALTIGYLWQNYGEDSVLMFSLAGMTVITIIMIIRSSVWKS